MGGGLLSFTMLRHGRQSQSGRAWASAVTWALDFWANGPVRMHMPRTGAWPRCAQRAFVASERAA